MYRRLHRFADRSEGVREAAEQQHIGGSKYDCKT